MGLVSETHAPRQKEKKGDAFFSEREDERAQGWGLNWISHQMQNHVIVITIRGTIVIGGKDLHYGVREVF